MLRIIALDVNNEKFVCESIVVITPGGKVMLIDGAFPGGSFSYGKNAFHYGANVIPPFLKHQGISTLDHVLISHLHDDHIGEIPRMILSGDVAVKQVLWSPLPNDRILEEEPEAGQQCVQLVEDLKASCMEKGVPMIAVNEGMLDLGAGVTIDILAVSKPDLRVPNYINNNSIVMRLIFGSFSMMFTGDAGREEEKRVMDTGRDLASDVLKIGHHAGADSTSQAWLSTVSARAGIASMPRWLSEDPRGCQTRALVESSGMAFYRTWEHGTIEVQTDGVDFRVVTEKNGSNAFAGGSQ